MKEGNMSDNMNMFLRFIELKNVSENDFAQMLIVWESVPFVDKMAWIRKHLDREHLKRRKPCYQHTKLNMMLHTTRRSPSRTNLKEY